MTLFTRTVFLDDTSILSKLDPGTWPERYGHIECRTSHDEIAQARQDFCCPAVSILTILKRNSQSRGAELKGGRGFDQTHAIRRTPYEQSMTVFTRTQSGAKQFLI